MAMANLLSSFLFSLPHFHSSGASVALLFTFVVSAFMLKWKSRKYDPPVPPGSLGLPFLGETIQFLHAMRTQKLYEFFQSRERKYGKVFKTHYFGCPTVVVPPHRNQFLFSNHNKLVTSKVVGQNALLFMDGQKNKNFRHILLAFLGPRALQSYVGKTSLLVQKHLDMCWQDKTEVKAYPLLKQALLSVVFELFLSLNTDGKELLHPMLMLLRGITVPPIDIPGTHFHKAKVARKTLLEKLDTYIQQRRIELEQGKATPNQDLLSVFITTKGEDGKFMTEAEIKDNILLLVLAGHDSTAGTLAMCIKCIAENPSCYTKLLQEHLEIAASKAAGEALDFNDVKKMNYTWNVVQESMRLVPAPAGNLRKALVDFEMDGFTIPKGWQLFWSVYTGNMKEEIFSEPNKFNPDRFDDKTLPPFHFTPFGGGPRMCPGMEYAKMQDCVFLHHLITRFNWSLLEPDELVQIIPNQSPSKGLPIRLLPNCKT